MTDNPTGPDLFKTAISYVDDINDGEADYVSDAGVYVDNRMLYAALAQVHATQANTAALVMLGGLFAGAMDVRDAALDGWTEMIPPTPQKECNEDGRRPECAERHTEDCAYADPPPESEPKLVPSAVPEKIRNLFQRRWACGVRTSGYHNGVDCDPEDPHDGWGCGYYWTVSGINDEVAAKFGLDGSTVEPEPQEPTSPRIYVEHRLGGTQGHIVAMVPLKGADDGTATAEVLWYLPGAQPVREKMGNLLFITADRIERCPNGQTGEECGSGENQCELCLADEDDEADAIERSMGL